MVQDPYTNPDAHWRKGAKRRRRGFPWYVVVVLVALIGLGGGLAWYLMNPPTPDEQIADVVPSFLDSWDSLSSDELIREWFFCEYATSVKLAKLLGRKGWSTSRPALTLVTSETSRTKTGARTDFHPEGLPADALVKIYWVKRYDHWRATKFTLRLVPDAGE